MKKNFLFAFGLNCIGRACELRQGMYWILCLFLWCPTNFSANLFGFFWSHERFFLRGLHLPNDDWRLWRSKSGLDLFTLINFDYVCRLIYCWAYRNSSLSCVFCWRNIWIFYGVYHCVHEILRCLNQRCGAVQLEVRNEWKVINLFKAYTIQLTYSRDN